MACLPVAVLHSGILQGERKRERERERERDMTELKTKEEWKELLDSVDTVLFDCDGKSLEHALHARAV